MTASYSGDPTTTRTDEVRFLLQDTGSPPLLADEEIDYVDLRLRAVHDDALMTAAVCADILAGRFADEVSISADGVSAGLQELQDKYRDKALNLRATYKALRGAGGAPLTGGIDRNTTPDYSLRPLSFGIGKDDNVRAGNQDFYQRPYNGAEYESGP
jgi:hypothetical protein